jgi:hypothetical protein
MKINRFSESKKASKNKDVVEIPFDVESTIVDKDIPGFKSKSEEITKAAEKKIKKDVQVTTPGLKKSIKKFEDFQISVSIDKIEPEDSVVGDDCCSDCKCNPCECVEETGKDNNDEVANVIPFVDFLKNNM